MIAALAACFGAALATAALADDAKTYDFSYATGGPKTTAQLKAALAWMDTVQTKSNGNVKFEVFDSGTLLKDTDMLPGIASGRADIGYIASGYFPGQLPLSSVVGIPFLTSNPEAQSRAFQELYDTDKAYHDEWEKQGVHVLHFFPATSAVLGTKVPVNSIKELAGKKIRGIGYVNMALEAAGANPVAIPIADLYESLQRGVVEGYSGIAFEVFTSFGLQEVAKYTADTGLGNYILAASIMNLQTWNSLPDDMKKLLTETSAENLPKAMEILEQTESGACDKLLAAGGKASVFSDDTVAEWKTLIGSRIKDDWLKKVGAGGEDLFNTYTGLLKKYEAQSSYQTGIRKCAQRR